MGKSRLIRARDFFIPLSSTEQMLNALHRLSGPTLQVDEVRHYFDWLDRCRHDWLFTLVIPV